MVRPKPMPPLSEFEGITYDPETGELWKNGRVCRSETQEYKHIRVGSRVYQQHRVAWYLHTGEDPDELTVDHKDHNRHNNKWSNLRLATYSQNKANTRAAKGYQMEIDGTFTACIWHGTKAVRIGNFATAEEAHAAYREEAVKRYGEFVPE